MCGGGGGGRECALCMGVSQTKGAAGLQQRNFGYEKTGEPPAAPNPTQPSPPCKKGPILESPPAFQTPLMCMPLTASLSHLDHTPSSRSLLRLHCCPSPQSRMESLLAGNFSSILTTPPPLCPSLQARLKNLLAGNYAPIVVRSVFFGSSGSLVQDNIIANCNVCGGCRYGMVYYIPMRGRGIEERRRSRTEPPRAVTRMQDVEGWMLAGGADVGVFTCDGGVQTAWTVRA